MPKHGPEGDVTGEKPAKIRRLRKDQASTSGYETAEEVLASLIDKQLDELIAPLSPTPEPFEAEQASSESSEDEIIPYVPLEATWHPRPGLLAAARAKREAERKSGLMAKLKALPKDVQIEYLGPDFDFENRNALDPYEGGTGIDHFSRIHWSNDDIPDVIVQLHPHVFIDLNKFREFVACIHGSDEARHLSESLWHRRALFEAPPHRSDDAGRSYCKRQDAEMSQIPSNATLLGTGARAGIRQEYPEQKLVDARTYTTLQKLLEPGNGPDHLNYLKSRMAIAEHEAAQLIDYNMYRHGNTPEIMARKDEHAFISGEMMKMSCDLLKASVFDMHDPGQIQLLKHPSCGIATGEYVSLFTYTRGNFTFPNATQTRQLGLPPDYEYKKEAGFPDEKSGPRNHLYESISPPEGVNSALEKKSPFIYRQIDFDALLKSNYNRTRHAISLLEDEVPLDLDPYGKLEMPHDLDRPERTKKPLDLDRCKKIMALLDLDDNLHHRNIGPEPSRERSIGRT